MGDASNAGSLFVDLGSGDGRVVDAVVRRFRCRGVGVEVMEESVAQAQKLATAPELEGRCRYLCADMGAMSLAETDVLFIYLPQPVLRGVVLNLLPRSGLRVGAR